MSEEYNDDRNSHKRNKRKKALPFGLRSRIAAAAAFILIAVAAVLIFNFRKTMSPENIENEAEFIDSIKADASVEITGSTVMEQNFQAIDDGFIYVSDTSITLLNHDCERVFSEKHSFTDPIVRSCGQYSIVFGEGTGGFKIIHNKHKIHEGVQGNAITDCDISASGAYCILSDKTGYLSCLTVYDKANEFVYSYAFSDYYAVSVSINDDGTKAAVGAINSESGRFVSKVYFLDLSSSEPMGVFTYNDQLIYSVQFLENGNLAVVTDMLSSVIRSDGSKETPFGYSSQLLTAYDIDRSSGIVLSLANADDGRSCTIERLDTEGHENAAFSTDLKVISLSQRADKTAALSYGKLTIFDSGGNVINDFDVGSDAKSVLYPHSVSAYILGVSNIRKVNLK